MNKITGHLKTVCKHKYYVRKYCFMAGIPLRGILHDLSKFSPTEFIESVKYYQGYRSPIDACKEVNGWSKAWMHHKGRNTHHYEYWMDNFDKGGQPIKMPFKCAVEMLCDYLGAGEAYQGKNFSFTSEYDWWLNKISKGITMHKDTITFINTALEHLKNIEEHYMNFNSSKRKRKEGIKLIINKEYLYHLYKNI